MAGPSVLMAATTRLVPAEKRGLATGIANAGGFSRAIRLRAIAQGLTVAAGWRVALQSLAAITAAELPAACCCGRVFERLRRAGAAAVKKEEASREAVPARWPT